MNYIILIVHTVLLICPIGYVCGNNAYDVGRYVYYKDIDEMPYLYGGNIIRAYDNHTYDIDVQDPFGNHTERGVSANRIHTSGFTCPEPARNFMLKSTDIAGIARSLHYNGFAVVSASNELDDTPPFSGYASEAHEVAKSMYEEVMQLSAEVGLDPTSNGFKYNEVSMRGKGRWEMLLSENWAHTVSRMWELAESSIIYPSLLRTAELEFVSPSFTYDNVCLFHGDTDCVDYRNPTFSNVFNGLVVSVSGAIRQHWHRDMIDPDLSHISAYIAGADVSHDMGPTEFLPGTNRNYSFIFSQYTKFFDTCSTSVSPLLRAGDMVLWDYRVIHRGRENTAMLKSENAPAAGFRPLLFRTYYLDGSLSDQNFNSVSFYKHVKRLRSRIRRGR